MHTANNIFQFIGFVFGCDFCSKTYASGESLKAQELQNINIRNIKCVNNGERLF
jgi:hypothetical protein